MLDAVAAVAGGAAVATVAVAAAVAEDLVPVRGTIRQEGQVLRCCKCGTDQKVGLRAALQTHPQERPQSTLLHDLPNLHRRYQMPLKCRFGPFRPAHRKQR